MAIFISYSRANSDFATRIARDLKAAGYSTWLDYLDIPKGARWDDEIEQALKGCDVFLILMSPDSVKSQNVKDEIGLAVDAGKHILPLLIAQCEVSLRLRRFQYVSFIDRGYDDGLAELKELLTIAGELPGAPRPDMKIGPIAAPPPKKTPAAGSGTFRNIFMGIAGIALLAMAWTGYQLLTKGERTPTATDPPQEVVTEAPPVETEAPTEASTEAPTEAPTEASTEAPTEAPTEASTEAPTEAPTNAPTEAPAASAGPVRIAYVIGTLNGQPGAIYVSASNGSGRSEVTEKDCLNGKPSWSPDGKSIIYQSNCAGSYDIWKVTSSGSGKQIFHGDPSFDEMEADFSPSGNEIVYVRYDKNRSGNTNGDIRIFELTGNDYSTGVEGRGPVFSPDGTRLVYMKSDGSRWVIFIYDIPSQNEQQVTTFLDKDARWPAWSPDGMYITFNSATGNGNTPTGIWTVANNGEDATTLINGSYGRPNWSENGSIIFNANDGLWVMNSDGSGAHPLTTDGGWAGVWSR